MIEVRSKLLPPADRVSVCAQSALDYSWMDQVDATKGVFITAEGLLMYLQPEESLGLIAECAKRFPGGRMMFDSPPALFARLVGTVERALFARRAISADEWHNARDAYRGFAL